MTTWTIGLIDFDFDSAVQQGDGRCNSRYTEKYLVRTDSATFPTPPAIAAAVGVVRGSPYSADTNAICHHINIGAGPTMTKVPHLAFTVAIEWATNATKPEDDDDDPLTMRTIWSINGEIQSRYDIKDLDGNMFVNTAGDPYAGGLPITVRMGTVTAQKNVLDEDFDKATVLAQSGKVNSETYLDAEPGTLQVLISAEETFQGAWHYWKLTYKLSYDPNGHQVKVASSGRRQRQEGSSGGETDAITYGDLGESDERKTATPIEEPQPLDEEGLFIPHDPLNPGACHIQDFRIVDEMDFADFDLL